jgi:tripartite-type tricarboxylate transporter receptor subunit TctC
MKRLKLPEATAALCLAALAATGPVSMAQSYPVKPIRVVVPFPPGGGVDLTGRLLQQRLAQGLGQAVIIENRAGATGMIGAEYVSRAAPDGYTLAFTVGSDMALKRFVVKEPTLDITKDFTAIASALESVSCIAVADSLKINSFKELIDMARRSPGKLNFGSAGMNSSQHLTGELLRMHGVEMTHVPFNGLAPALVALMGGQVEVAVTNIASVTSQLRDGKVKVLAVTRPKRYEDAPNIPTVGELLPGFNMPVAFFGFLGPPGMPQPVVGRISSEVGRALEAPEVTAKAKELSMSVLYAPPEQFTAMIRNAVEAYGKIAQTAGIKPQ